MSSPGQPIQIVSIPAKSPGIAVLLSFIWLGAGHLYANKVGTGSLLVIFDFFLLLLALTGVGLLVAVPIWLVAAPCVMLLSAGAVNSFNRRNGLAVR